MPYAVIHHSATEPHQLVDGEGKYTEQAENWASPELSLHWGTGVGNMAQFEVKLDARAIVETARMIEGGSYGDNPKMVGFFSVAMDRVDLQEMVKTGRRARNAVYGEDA